MNQKTTYDPDEHLTIPEFQRIARIGLTLAYKIVKDELPHIRVGGGEKRGGRILVRRADVDRWLASRTKTATKGGAKP